MRVLTCLTAALVFMVAMAAATPAAAEPPPWPEVPFSYLGKEQRLDKMIAGFAKTFGLELRLESSLPDDLAAMSGRTSASTPTEFINQVSAAYGLVWYYHMGVLYVSRNNERITHLVPTKGLSGTSLKKAFTEMGIVDPKFGWGEVDDRGAVMVSGPRSYVARIEEAMKAFPEPPSDQQILVFRLKHAEVSDRTIQYRDKQIVTPGVATMLRNLLGASGPSGGTVTEVMDTVGTVRSAAPLVADNSSSDASAQPAAPKGKAARDSKASASPVVIQADPRLNAIIIKDKAQNAPIYKELIDMLDVPSTLIEIEAAIVDVNTTSLTELGIDWNGRRGNLAGGFGTPDTPPDGTTLTLVHGLNVNPTTVIADAGNFLMTRIKLLEGKGNAKIVSRPFVLTQDNMGALIDVSDTFYIQTTGERVATVTPISVGTTLKVTPHVVVSGNTRSIQLVVDIEDGSIQAATTGSALPTVRRSVIGTQALVGENESLLIGGLNTEQETREKDKVPMLGDIPGVGLLFSKTNGSTQKSERMYLITPKIVMDPNKLAAAAAAAAALSATRAR
ncbi:MAG TPA: type III secretion system outer membrane ring subunit SctC [Ramlibacter sp.]|nr:type III secretion system outer membrane ring subunit SctC [Ramlibacter sp.]